MGRGLMRVGSSDRRGAGRASASVVIAPALACAGVRAYETPAHRRAFRGSFGLEAVDVGDELVDGGKALGLAEIDVAAVLELAYQLDHVEGVDVEGFEG